MDKYIGRLLDNRYEILETIGTGGMAVVYKARCHRLNRLVAVKILKDDYMGDEEFRRRFHSESQAVAMLSHPNIVSVYDVSTSIMADYIVMELIDGITLKQYMEKKGVLNWKETLHFAIQIAKALEHAHSRGIVHRDIKPHNVMVLKNGSVKVTDFGIARVMSQSNTLTKEALGSVHYISPEQAKGGRVDNRSDIYSLGTVMYEMMSGRPPYDGESPVAVAIKHINGGAPLPSTLNPNMPGGLEQIIMHAMALEPAQRYDTASAMLRDLDEFRKNPGILFDYNVPPLDDVIQMQRPPLVLNPEQQNQTNQPKTIAEKTVEKKHANPTPKTNRGGPPARTNVPQNRRRRDPREEEKNKTATTAIIVCSIVLLLAIIAVIVASCSGTPEPVIITVPNLLGKDFDSLATTENYIVKLHDRVHDSEYEAGQIIEQNPAAGEQIEKGKTIYVTVSLGEAPEEVKMPDVVGRELEDAKRRIENLNINPTFEIVKESHDDIPKDHIIRTDPVADTVLKTGQKITLVVSTGLEYKEAEMLDVVGDEKEEAVKKLNDQKLGLEFVFEEVFDSKIPEGHVTATLPAAGEVIVTGDKITIYISKGINLVPMSAVLDMKANTATDILKQAGFENCTYEWAKSDKERETVIGIKVDDKEVKPGDKIDASKTVVLVLSEGLVEKTKNVTITLQTDTSEDPFWVRVYRESDETAPVFEKEVPAGTTQIVLENQTESGKVKYIVREENMPDDWIHTEDFS